MVTTSSRSPSDSGAQTPRGHARTWRVGILVGTAVAAAIVASAASRQPQPPGYLDFADERRLLGIPNGLNVLSNVAFLAVGLAGLAALLGKGVRFRNPQERAPWVVFFGGVVLTGAGSAWFHLAPSMASLVWDRLPMAIGFMGLLSALVAERVDAVWGRRLLWPLVGLGLSTVVYWSLTERSGVGDLRPYLLVQFYPLVALPLLVLLFPSRCSGSRTYLVALGAYLAAKVAELLDGAIHALGGLVSGHTLKHLLAAAGIGAIAWMLVHRHPLEPARAVTRSLRGGSP